MNKSVQIPLWLLQRAIDCIARAENEKAFAGCVVPSVGEKTLAALQACYDNARA